jgi:NADH-quinone oxidoreductase subunit A
VPVDYLPIFIYILLAIAIGCGGIIGLSALLGPRRPNKIKLMPYECGVDPVGSPRERFPIKFYVVGMIFLLFDIEVVFMIPWAVNFKQLGMFGLIEMIIFIAILGVGYLYLWRKGALDWE